MGSTARLAVIVGIVLVAWFAWPWVRGVFVASSLSDFTGRTGVVYLRTSPPGSPGTSHAGDGLKLVNGVPTAVLGRLVYASGRGVVMEMNNRETWIPLESIAAVSFPKEIPENWSGGTQLMEWAF